MEANLSFHTDNKLVPFLRGFIDRRLKRLFLFKDEHLYKVVKMLLGEEIVHVSHRYKTNMEAYSLIAAWGFQFESEVDKVKNALRVVIDSRLKQCDEVLGVLHEVARAEVGRELGLRPQTSQAMKRLSEFYEDPDTSLGTFSCNKMLKLEGMQSMYVHKLAPRGIYTSVRGSFVVDLTAYVSKDPETSETILESGALVLSDRDICCIDEFDKMPDNARSMLHEVMKQKIVSIAKARMIASLNARTSVLACANPSSSHYNPRLSVIDNIQLPPTLLSRFDLIYLVLDKANEQTDRCLARHLVVLHYDEPEDQTLDALDLPTLTSYITYARQHIHPKIFDEAAEEF
ncbi:DNA replication licensing factor MCM4-like [Cryptomeria japonica]|uniref:DNA replication licensing factor MCM4-like n=1 Tax=Cryptomeria japonica TaxID=3369 RepID=UPI0027D9FC09|nr:DNA replication licensing factor MCM4-like [Cryptomeria japonica]